jgi:hypothetical protein
MSTLAAASKAVFKTLEQGALVGILTDDHEWGSAESLNSNLAF